MLPLRQHYYFRIRIFRRCSIASSMRSFSPFDLPRHRTNHISPVNPATPDYASRRPFPKQKYHPTARVEGCSSLFNPGAWEKTQRHINNTHSLTLYILQNLDPEPRTLFPQNTNRERERDRERKCVLERETKESVCVECGASFSHGLYAVGAAATAAASTAASGNSAATTAASWEWPYESGLSRPLWRRLQ